MGKIINHGNRKEKGITLVEAVISLSIITIISAAVVTLTVTSASSVKNTRDKNFFMNETANFASFYLTYDEENFVNAINETTNVEESTNYHNFTIYYSSNKDYSNQSDKSFYINLVFSNSNNTLTLSCYDYNDSLLYERRVSK